MRFNIQGMPVVARPAHMARLERLLRERPVVALLGARQVGKTTLARALARRWRGPSTIFDLEDPRDLGQLDEPTLALEGLRGLVVLDEIQARPQLFPVLRVLADRPRRPARFLVLGSATPDLLRQGAETLAGRIGFHELGGFDLEEVGATRLDRLWFRGGFPLCLPRDEPPRERRVAARLRPHLSRARHAPAGWLAAGRRPSERFWTMLAHYHGQVWNASAFARSFGVSHTTVRKYLDLLSGAFVVEQLRPWAENVGKRVVRSPKVYLADSGILHALLGLATPAGRPAPPGARCELGGVRSGPGATDAPRPSRGVLLLGDPRGSRAGSARRAGAGDSASRSSAPTHRRSPPRCGALWRRSGSTVSTWFTPGHGPIPFTKGIRAVSAAGLSTDLTALRR